MERSRLITSWHCRTDTAEAPDVDYIQFKSTRDVHHVFTRKEIWIRESPTTNNILYFPEIITVRPSRVNISRHWSYCLVCSSVGTETNFFHCYISGFLPLIISVELKLYFYIYTYKLYIHIIIFLNWSLSRAFPVAFIGHDC